MVSLTKNAHTDGVLRFLSKMGFDAKGPGGYHAHHERWPKAMLLNRFATISANASVGKANLSMIGAGCSGWFPGPLKFEGTNNFRGLTEAIVEQQRRLAGCAAKS
jgi:hypothetical protein